MKIVNLLKKKLQSSSAETLTETLVSILIISIVSVTLATMIRTASRVNEKAREYDLNLDQAVASLNTTTGDTTSVILSIDGGSNGTYPVSIKAGTNENGKNPLNLYAYSYKAG